MNISKELKGGNLTMLAFIMENYLTIILLFSRLALSSEASSPCMREFSTFGHIARGARD